MTLHFLGPDPVASQVDQVLAQLAAGELPANIERTQVDIKEEPGRRGQGGVLLPGQDTNGDAAKYLAGGMACLANTPGGGAIIVGIADDGTRIGTNLDQEWLRNRIWQLTESRLTISVRVAMLDNARLLVLTTHEAIEPIRYGGRLKWRLDDNCVEIDATSWHTDRMYRTGVDWSAQPSGYSLQDVSAIAAEIAKRYLVAAAAAGDEGASSLASATTPDLLRRLNLVDGDDRLTNAGSLLFQGTPHFGIDYIRREVPGGDSTNRIRSTLPLLEQILEVEKASASANRIVHIPDGFAHGQLRALPSRALREAIINGVVHRDWLSPEPTTVEHVGDHLTVSSPGGFLGGIDPSNIITHPAVPRYRSLAEAMATLRLAEREGVGVDRMVRDMLALGHRGPSIAEIAGPYVRVTLLGGDPDAQTLEILSATVPDAITSDVDALLLLHHLTQRGWVDVKRAAPLLQRPEIEAEAAMRRLGEATYDDAPVVVPIKGVPVDHPGAYRLGDAVRSQLKTKMAHLDSPEARQAVILEWAQARGRVSTTEAADITSLSVPYVSRLLTSMEEDGLLCPGRPSKVGRGFYYTPAMP